MNRLQGKMAIITGVSRNRGIGSAIARVLASEGADIFFTHWCRYDKDQPYGAEYEWPREFAEELRSCGVRVESMELDLSDPLSPVQLLDEAERKLGLPSLLVNNATYCKEADYRELSAEILNTHCAVNITGTCMLSVEFARRQAEGNGGRIINMVSGQDKGPMPGNLAYVATKGAISAFTVSLAAELAPLRITVNAVDPGPTDSGWMDDSLKQYLLPKFPMGRVGQPDDAAKLISFLCQNDAQWITGQIIHSDGGFWG
ncbi:SDR family oxidoreductase [Paenibacillus paeoniae]|uniref:SDR family NAD(P)-dependent oxidoreductase n=1 Tax=Paenibacillus paeoniae TaxID=2292705 RepID=A0A371PEW7_9BACL|nr:SDR family oxidoreductase [Paenibacillus paeoniae]REK74449.1 SDR family NAD(P)-dependent oxidoreductase [Paenibacillus paeoniae]